METLQRLAIGKTRPFWFIHKSYIPFHDQYVSHAGLEEANVEDTLHFQIVWEAEYNLAEMFFDFG